MIEINRKFIIACRLVVQYFTLIQLIIVPKFIHTKKGKHRQETHPRSRMIQMEVTAEAIHSVVHTRIPIKLQVVPVLVKYSLISEILRFI